MNWKTVAKAIVAGITAFLSYYAAKKIALEPEVEATLSVALAALAVYITRNDPS